jgi:hypothetical protein
MGLATLTQNADIVWVPLSPLLAPAFDKMFQIGMANRQKPSKPKGIPGLRTLGSAGAGAITGAVLAAPTGGLSVAAGAGLGAAAGGLFGASSEFGQ